MQERIEGAYKSAVAVKRAEAAVVRAAVRLHRVQRGERVVVHKYGRIGTVTAAHLVALAVEKLLKARKGVNRRRT